MSIGALLGMPAAQGLFHKAVMQSGATKHIHAHANATAAAVAIMQRLDLRRDEVEALRTVPVERLLEAARAIEEEGRYNLPLLFQPVVDDRTLPEWPITGPNEAEMAITQPPVLIGTTRDESRLFTVRDPGLSALDEEGLLAKVAAVAGAERAPAILRAYRETRPGETPLHIWDAISTDADFRIPALRAAERLVARGSPVWMYRFDYAMTTLGGVFGACHGLDVPFVWNALDKPAAVLLVGDSPATPALARRMQASWVAFARTGDPNTPELPSWPMYTRGERETMLLNLECSLARDPAGDERRLWEGVR
jgi:para-nitrobenzyl esterase